MNESVLCADIGTTSLKAALLAKDGAVSAFCRIPIDGIAQYAKAFGTARHVLLSQAPAARVEGICISGNGPTVCTESGTGLMWNSDTREHDERCASLNIRSRFIPKLLALKSLHPQAWSMAEWILGAPEQLIFSLTNHALAILPNARFESAYWRAEDLRSAGFTDSDKQKLPPFAKPGSLAGHTAEGIPVFCGAPDYIAGTIGTNTLCPGALFDRAGSSQGINLVTCAPIQAEGLLTLPHFLPDLWNISCLIPDSGALLHSDRERLLRKICGGIERLQDAARNAAQPCAERIATCGGQCSDNSWIQAKANATRLRYLLPECSDSELSGDAALAWTALGAYSSVAQAARAMFRIKKEFTPQ